MWIALGQPSLTCCCRSEPSNRQAPNLTTLFALNLSQERTVSIPPRFLKVASQSLRGGKWKMSRTGLNSQCLDNCILKTHQKDGSQVSRKSKAWTQPPDDGNFGKLLNLSKIRFSHLLNESNKTSLQIYWERGLEKEYKDKAPRMVHRA